MMINQRIVKEKNKIKQQMPETSTIGIQAENKGNQQTSAAEPMATAMSILKRVQTSVERMWINPQCQAGSRQSPMTWSQKQGRAMPEELRNRCYSLQQSLHLRLRLHAYGLEVDNEPGQTNSSTIPFPSLREADDSQSCPEVKKDKRSNKAKPWSGQGPGSQSYLEALSIITESQTQTRMSWAKMNQQWLSGSHPNEASIASRIRD